MAPQLPYCVSSLTILLENKLKGDYLIADVASGSSVDWVFNELDKKVGFTIEFRDKGKFGFVLPPAQILANCEELMAGMVALIEKTNNLGYI